MECWQIPYSAGNLVVYLGPQETATAPERCTQKDQHGLYTETAAVLHDCCIAVPPNSPEQ
jgi:hypothetical protein